MALTGGSVVLNLSTPDTMKHVEQNDFIAHLRSFQGGIERSTLAGKVSTAYTVIEPLQQADPGFFRWVLKSPGFIGSLAAGLEQLRDGQSVKFQDFAKILLPLPPMEEQRRIAEFLDDRVARIDRIIAARTAQRRLGGEAFRSFLEVRLWRRTATLPAKYHLVDVTSGPRGWGDFVADVGTPFVRIGNLAPLGIELREQSLVSVEVPDDAESRRAALMPGDVLLSITAAFGEVAVWREGAGTFSQHVARLRLLDASDADWLAWVLQTHSAHDQYRLSAYGGTKIGMGLDQVRNLSVPDVSAADRAEAIRDIAAAWSQHEIADSSLGRSIDLLNEYKQSLITAAVTGELDVTTAGSRIPG